jgi:hypothetical protein
MPILADKGKPFDGAAPGAALSPPVWGLVDNFGGSLDADDEPTKLVVDTSVLRYDDAEDIGEDEAVLVCSAAFSAM